MNGGGSQLILALPAQLENDEASPRGHSEQGSKYCLNSAYFWDAWNAWNAWGGYWKVCVWGASPLSYCPAGLLTMYNEIQGLDPS